jgi:hypothetical protein
MTRLAFHFLLVTAYFAGSVGAQEPMPVQPSPSDLPAPRLHVQTGSQHGYVTPREIARMRAAAEAEQRHARLSAQRWYGYSPLRPIVSADPTMSNYFPIWNTDVARPFIWYSTSYPATFDRAIVGEPR